MSEENHSPHADVTKRVLSMWKEFSKQMEEYMDDISPENIDDYKELYEHWKEYQERSLESINQAVDSPDTLPDMFKEWIELSQEFGSVLESYDGPKFPDEVIELYENYMEQIREPILETLSLSIREQFKKQQELYNKWMDSWAEVSKDDDFDEIMNYFKEKWMGSAGKMSAEFMEAVKEGDADGLYRRMEREWMKATSDMVQKILMSRPYAMAQGTYVDNLLDSRITQRELMDNYLKSLGMPTRDDMLKLYESVHELTSRIRKIERKLDNLPVD
ncbi:MAG: poly(R)-hydroxyalkanoic acid synthase subunit PhaE [Thermoplasmata archaeon]